MSERTPEQEEARDRARRGLRPLGEVSAQFVEAFQEMAADESDRHARAAAERAAKPKAKPIRKPARKSPR